MHVVSFLLINHKKRKLDLNCFFRKRLVWQELRTDIIIVEHVIMRDGVRIIENFPVMHMQYSYLEVVVIASDSENISIRSDCVWECVFILEQRVCTLCTHRPFTGYSCLGFICHFAYIFLVSMHLLTPSSLSYSIKMASHVYTTLVVSSLRVSFCCPFWAVYKI